MSGAALLTVSDLTVEVRNGAQWVRPVDGVSLALERGTIMGLVGESGSGKSLTCLAIMGLVPESAMPAVSGAVTIDGKRFDLAAGKGLERVRGRGAAMIFQNPSSFLDPLMPIWRLIAEPLLIRERLGHARAREQAIVLMRRVGLPDPEGVAGAYPHQLSGGMKQRVMIAAALACRPKLLIADEPTTALDVTVQMQILQLLRELADEAALSIILVTHDLAVVSMVCDSISVMYCGRIVERGSRQTVLGSPAHPYTRALLGAEPGWGGSAREFRPIPGQLPLLTRLPSGCRYHPRCDFMRAECTREDPALEEVADGHFVACLRAAEVLRCNEPAD
ncbi:MAG: ABC transporter ATP-binding protein [Acetobacteraceae bacterium]